jgi:hypothetical protein
MIELLLVFILLEFIYLLFIIFKISNFVYLIPDTNNIRINNYLIPKLDIDTIPVDIILNSLSNYREFINYDLLHKEISKETVERNYKVISCIISKNKSNSIEDNPILFKINSFLIKNKSGLIDFLVIESIVEKKVDQEILNINYNLKFLLQICSFGILVIFTQYFFKISEFFIDNESLFNINTSFHLIIFYSLTLMLISYLFYLILNYLFHNKSLKTLNNNINNLFYFLQANVVPIYSSNLSENIFQLSQNLHKFNKDFYDNLRTQSEHFVKTQDHLVLQEKILNKLEVIDPVQIAQVNIQILKELNNNINNFKILNEHFSNLNHIVEVSSNLFIVAEKTFDKFTNFDTNINKIADGINLRLQESTKLLEFLGSHLSTLENRKNEMDSIIITTDTILKNSYKELVHSENEILLSFKERTLSSTEELKKIVQEYVRQTKEISLDLYNNINSLDNTFKNLSNSSSLMPPSNTYESLDIFASSLKEVLSRFEITLNSYLENGDKRDGELINLMKSASVNSESANNSKLETDLQKLLTQINLNQIYFENILKELLKELRSETNKNTEIAKISYLKLTISKIKNLFS